MAPEKSAFVYMLASKPNGTLYVGVTSNLVRRIYQHKTKAFEGFSAQYGVDRLVWFEPYDRMPEAIAREKQLEKWRRQWKVSLIEENNPRWEDLWPAISQ